MTDFLGFLKTRRGMLAAAAVLLLIALGSPAPWGDAKGRTSSTAVWLIARWMRPELFSPDPAGGFVSQSWVLGLMAFTNIAFVVGFGMRGIPRPSRGLQGLLIGAVVVDVAAAFVLRDLARMPGYWLWVAALAAVMWAFVARPATGPAPPGYWRQNLLAADSAANDRTGVPSIVLVWLGWFVFWSAISGLSPFVKPETEKPAALTGYVNDVAGTLSRQTSDRLDAALERFEKETSTQIALAVFPKLPDVSVEEFTLSVAEASRLGRKGLDNGAILSVFEKDRVARLEVGYGLEEALPDAVCHRLLDSVFAPAWSRGDRDQAVERTLGEVMALVKESYRAGKRPGRLNLFWRQLIVEVPRFLEGVVPVLVATPTDVRIGISFFGTLLLFGFFDGFVQTRNLLRTIYGVLRKLVTGRAIKGMNEPLELGSAIDTLKILLFAGVVVGIAIGTVMVAGGGAFGGAGSLTRW